MQQIQIGARVKPMGINRVNVADGCVRRAILLDPNPQFKYVAWDENLKRRVEVDQDMVIKYGLSPTTQFYYLVAMLNTDQMGNVVGDQFTVEYLQLSEGLNNEFSNALVEMGNFTSLHLTKVPKKGDNGKDYGYVKVTPSNYTVDNITGLMDKINALRSQQDAIRGMWALIDAATSINKESYLKLLSDKQALPAGAQQAPHPAQLSQSQTAPTRQPAPQPAAPQMPHGAVPGFDSQEFQNPDDFAGDNF